MVDRSFMLPLSVNVEDPAKVRYFWRLTPHGGEPRRTMEWVEVKEGDIEEANGLPGSGVIMLAGTLPEALYGSMKPRTGDRVEIAAINIESGQTAGASLRLERVE